MVEAVAAFRARPGQAGARVFLTTKVKSTEYAGPQCDAAIEESIATAAKAGLAWVSLFLPHLRACPGPA